MTAKVQKYFDISKFYCFSASFSSFLPLITRMNTNIIDMQQDEIVSCAEKKRLPIIIMRKNSLLKRYKFKSRCAIERCD